MFAWLKRVLRIGREGAGGPAEDLRGDAFSPPADQMAGGEPPARSTDIHPLPDKIGVADRPDGPCFAVRFGEHVSPEPVTEDPWELPLRTRLLLAFRVTPGADRVSPVMVDRHNISGWSDDEFCRYECLVRPTRENCLALQATRLAWTEAAERLAGPWAAPPGAVEAVQRAMAEFLRREYQNWRRGGGWLRG